MQATTSPIASPIDPQALRRALGNFATGVAVVTARDEQQRPIGLTVNSFTSVSLSPPLVLFCLARHSSNLAAFQQATSFAVNVLHSGQDELSRAFASPVPDRFAGVTWQAGALGDPLITDAAAHFECVRHETLAHGDHLIFLGQVQHFGHAPVKEPLLYFQGRFRQVAALPA